MKVMTFEELTAEVDRREALIDQNKRPEWNGWAINEDHIFLHDPRWPDDADADLYWFDRTPCTSLQVQWKWVCQLAEKTWATDAILAGLVRLFAHTFGREE